jgi:hypothetical protein
MLLLGTALTGKSIVVKATSFFQKLPGRVDASVRRKVEYTLPFTEGRRLCLACLHNHLAKLF